MKRPRPGDPSYPLYHQEIKDILRALGEKAALVHTKMNEIPGVRCNEVQGAMYAYPQVDIPEEAEVDAKVCNFFSLQIYALHNVKFASDMDSQDCNVTFCVH